MMKRPINQQDIAVFSDCNKLPFLEESLCVQFLWRNPFSGMSCLSLPWLESPLDV